MAVQQSNPEAVEASVVFENHADSFETFSLAKRQWLNAVDVGQRVIKECMEFCGCLHRPLPVYLEFLRVNSLVCFGRVL